MPTNDDGTKSFAGAEVPNNHKEALIQLAHSKSTAHNRRTLSDELRDAIEEYLNEHWKELPPEAKDSLDEDLLANAGGTDNSEVEA